MRRAAPYLTFLFGGALLALLLPPFLGAQPKGLSVTRTQVRALADAAARKTGIEVDGAFAVIHWDPGDPLREALSKDPKLLEEAERDPALAPRLGCYEVKYFRKGVEKWNEFGIVWVGLDGAIVGARRRERPDFVAPKAEEAELRRRADAFLASGTLPGVPAYEFDAARPTVLKGRTDVQFRYKVPSRVVVPGVSSYVGVYFIGPELAGWLPYDERDDGRPDNLNSGGLTSAFLTYGVIGTLLALLLTLFLRKYHAGEVGIGSGAVLLLVAAGLLVVAFYLPNSGESVYTGFGSIDALQTALAMYAFKLLFFGVPVLLLVFVGWSVGESFARERWGERLAAFDALLSRDLRNATVGRAVLLGTLAAPALAAVTLLPGRLLLAADLAFPALGTGTRGILLSVGGPLGAIAGALFSALLLTVVPILFLLAWANRRRALPLGFALLAVAGAGLADAGIPLDPLLPRLLANAVLACAAGALFLYADLLAAAIALVGANLLLGVGPYALVTLGPARTQALVALAVPFALLLVLAAMGLATGRYVTYTYEDLAPHVKRIVERERVKAEIDAANRIQSALLPSQPPEIRGAGVASHYQAATEIGGDYFDFLPLPGGRLGIAFGDVAGHGLTSGIVMAMAKSALLVQIGYDASPTRVLEVLNDIVMKTAPKRMLMTFFFGVLDPDKQVLRFSSAGHLDPFVFRASTGQVEALSAWGFPLGVKRREPFREMVARFFPGDRLVLFSDGLIEAVDDDDEPFGFPRFEEILKANGEESAERIQREILAALKRFTRNRPPEDDQTLVVFSFDGEERLRKAS
ncbi:MAG: PP2C family protein-serine/threonine phosphatase [Acidobacteria bacterium]|nr:PP2C family protein-serine/threonine phosphatase [Acidobacteriota bacterium]